MERLSALEKIGFQETNEKLSRALDESLALWRDSMGWSEHQRVRVLSLLAKFSIARSARDLTIPELESLLTLSSGLGIAGRASVSAVLLLLAERQPVAGQYFERVYQNIPEGSLERFSYSTAFNLYALLMSYGFEAVYLTRRLVRVVRRFVPELIKPGPRYGVFVGRALASTEQPGNAFEAYAEALKHPAFDQALRALDKGGTPHSIMQEVFHRFGQTMPERVLELLDDDEKGVFQSVDWNAARCQLLTQSKQTIRAIECLEKSIEESPKQAKLYFEKASLLLQIRRHDAAIKAFEEGLAVDPNDVRAQQLLEILKSQKGQLGN